MENLTALSYDLRKDIVEIICAVDSKIKLAGFLISYSVKIMIFVHSVIHK